MPGETSGQTSIVEQVFGIRMLQRMQSLQGARRVSQRETRCFQVTLTLGLCSFFAHFTCGFCSSS